MNIEAPLPKAVPDRSRSGASSRGAMIETLSFLEDVAAEMDGIADQGMPNPHFRMALHLIRQHLDARTVTPTSLMAAAQVPYATANRRLREMTEAGLIDRRPRTRSGKSVSLHPSAKLLARWQEANMRVRRLAHGLTGPEGAPPAEGRDYYFGGSYLATAAVGPMKVRSEPLALPGGLRVLVHGDPTFMVMADLKRQFEQALGTEIHQRAFSIDRLRAEAIRNAERRTSRYDLIAVDLPWFGEYVQRGMVLPLDEVMPIEAIDPSDFHTAAWAAVHIGGRPYGIPAQATPELLFYRRDLLAEAGLEPPGSTDALLAAARALHAPARGRYGIAWNAARGTALGHTFMMACADFGQPILDLPPIAGGFDATAVDRGDLRPMFDSARAQDAAQFLMALLDVSPPDILSMSWYERVRPYAEGRVALAYGYTLLAPYFEKDPGSPARGTTGYLPHPPSPGASPVAPVGGYALAIPTNLPEDRRGEAAAALAALTGPEAQKLVAMAGSRTNPRYSVSADPDVRRLSPIFDAVDGMSWRDELQYWPRPPAPEISGLVQIAGEELHDMLRGVVPVRQALEQAQKRAEELMKTRP